jgi:hypothetical protein
MVFQLQYVEGQVNALIHTYRGTTSGDFSVDITPGPLHLRPQPCQSEKIMSQFLKWGLTGLALQDVVVRGFSRNFAVVKLAYLPGPRREDCQYGLLKPS